MRLVLPSRDTEPGVFEHLYTVLIGGLEPPPSGVLEAPTLESLYSSVVARLGIGIISESRSALLPNDTVVCRPFVAPAPTADLVVIWKPDRVGHPLGSFLDVVRGVTSRQERRDRFRPDPDAHLEPVARSVPDSGAVLPHA